MRRVDAPHGIVYETEETCTYRYLYVRGVFRFLYRTDNSAASPASLEASRCEVLPDYILRIAEAFDEAYDIFTQRLHLRDPLQEGYFAREEARGIAVVIDDIPARRGLVSGSARRLEACIARIPEAQGRFIRIRLHRDLIARTATPIHELFHVFQYGYAPFTNGWFMEGLARWSQNLTHDRTMKPTRLPESLEELKALLDLAHEAEYFWRVLFDYCPAERFLAPFLEAVGRKARAFEAADASWVWDKENKRAYRNDRRIVEALLETIETSAPHEKEIPARFLNVCRTYVERGATDIDEITLARLYEALAVVAPDTLRYESGERKCDAFDPATGRLRADTVHIDGTARGYIDALQAVESLDGDLVFSGTDMAALDGFNRLRRVRTLRIENNTRLESVDGFNALRTLETLEIKANPRLMRIDGFRSLFRFGGRIEGAIKIVKNRSLESVAFLSGLRSTGSSLYLHHNALKGLEGLEALEEVGASLSLSSNRLRSLQGLDALRRVGGMLNLAHNRLETLRGIEKLTSLKTVRWNGIPRTLTLHGNPGLRDIRALERIETAQHYIVMTIDDPSRYEKKPNATSPFHRNILELYEEETATLVPTYRFVRKTRHDYRRFRRATHAGILTHLVDFEVPSDTLVVSFSGYNGYLGGVFHNRYPWITETAPSHKLFIMDKHNGWYHLGVEGLARDWNELLALIERLIAEGGYARVVCTGASMGGYAALVCATVKGVTDVIALSPQTFLDDANRSTYGETRWRRDLRRVSSQTPTPEFLDVAALWKVRGIAAKRIRILYAKRIGLDEVHARRLENERVEHMPFDVDTHYLAAWLHKRKALRPLILSTLGADPNRPRVLFGPKWKKATSRCEWMDAFHLGFGTPEEVAEYAWRHDVTVIFANNYATQRWLSVHGETLRRKGFAFLVNPRRILDIFVDKRRFRDAMREAGFEAYLPERYRDAAHARFPCVVKPPSGGAGRGVYIARKAEDVVTEEGVMLEAYLPGEEYATSMFLRDDRVLHHRTYRKRVGKEPFVLQQSSDVTVEAVPTPFAELFGRIVRALYGGKGHCMCSLNYKIVDGVPKIFEINPRTGYTLAQHPEDFREFMAIYIEEAMREEEADA